MNHCFFKDNQRQMYFFWTTYYPFTSGNHFNHESKGQRLFGGWWQVTLSTD